MQKKTLEVTSDEYGQIDFSGINVTTICNVYVEDYRYICVQNRLLNVTQDTPRLAKNVNVIVYVLYIPVI